MKTNELKCTDLRIGNLLKFDDEIVIVYELYDDSISILEDSYVKVYHIDNFEPIELTEELLVKIGFKKEERISSILYYLDYGINEDEYIRVRYVIYDSKALPLLRITSPGPIISERYELTKRGVKYLHELQNAYYLLTNEELEVEL